MNCLNIIGEFIRFDCKFVFNSSFIFSRASFLREYTRMLPFGLGIAGSFLPILHDPIDKSDYELFNMEEQLEKAKEMFLEKCGKTVDIELKSLVHHIYELMLKLEMVLD